MKDLLSLARVGAQTMASMVLEPNAFPKRSFSSEYTRRLASTLLDEAVSQDDNWLRRKQRLLSMKGPALLKVDTEHEVIGDVPCLRVKPKGSKKCARKVLYFHGGGYVVGSARSYHYTYAKLALALNAEVVGLDYSLAPEHSVANIIDEGLRVYDLIQSIERPEQVLLAGDSAGGGAAIALTRALMSRGAIPSNLYCLLISPWVDPVDPSCLDASKAEGDLLNVGILKKWHAAVAKDEGYETLVRFVACDWAGFPPTIVQAGGAEMFLPQIETLVSDMTAAGVKVHYDVFPDQFHVFQTLAPLVSEADEAWNNLAASVRAMEH